MKEGEESIGEVAGVLRGHPKRGPRRCPFVLWPRRSSPTWRLTRSSGSVSSLPNFAKYEFAPFISPSSTASLPMTNGSRCFHGPVSSPKSTLTMMVYPSQEGKKNVILASATEDSAIKLLRPYMREFECNGRIKAFYGEQVGAMEGEGFPSVVLRLWAWVLAARRGRETAQSVPTCCWWTTSTPTRTAGTPTH